MTELLGFHDGLSLAWLVAPWQEFIRHHIGDADHTKKAFEPPQTIDQASAPIQLNCRV